MPWKLVIRSFSPGKGQGKLFVFIFHRVLEKPDPLLSGEPDGKTFDWMVRFISKSFNVLPFGTAVERLKQGDLPAAAACITFDDGYRDNYTVALPILQRHGVKATFFIATGFLGGGRMWNDDLIEAVRSTSSPVVDWSEFGLGNHDFSTPMARSTSLGAILGKLKYFPHEDRANISRRLARSAGVSDHSNLMMSAEEVRSLHAAGMEIGSHTRTHPILSGLTDEQAMIEIGGGKADLEAILDQRVDVFAYPNGNPMRDLTIRNVQLVEAAGFRAAATTAWGIGTKSSNPLLLPRFTPWDREKFRFSLRCAVALSRSSEASSLKCNEVMSQI